MWAAVYRGKNRVQVESLPIPLPRAGEVLVKIDSCGVCATDLKKVEYGLVPPPRVFGHEMAGTIQKVGKGVRIPCRRCFYCDRQEYSQCVTYKRTGTTAGFEPAGGGFAQYIRVLPWIVKQGMVHVPRGVTLEEASFIEPVNTCLKGVDRLSSRRGDFVMIFGQGPIGLIFTQIVKARGCKVIALDLMTSRQKLARRLGATLVTDPRSSLFSKRLLKITHGRGADAAILAVPSEAAFQQALRFVRPGGKILLFAHTKRGDMLKVDAGAVCVDEKTVLGSYSASVDVQAEAARLIFSRKVKVGPLITHRFPLNQIEKAFRLASNPTKASLKILVKPQTEIPRFTSHELTRKVGRDRRVRRNSGGRSGGPSLPAY
jgi:L-iditol 2-dehydrogenase